MPSTYTTNLGAEKPAIGEQAGSWGTTLNTNFDIYDTAISGQLSLTLAATGSTGSPNDLPVTDGTASNGQNAYINVTDGGDLGGDAYLQLTPNDSERIIWIKNSLSGSRSLYVFQGTYNASNDYVLGNGNSALLKFDGGGAGAVVTAIITPSSGVGSGTKTEFNTALTDGSFAFDGGAHHDGFSDYVANEHLDWTQDLGATNLNANNSANGVLALTSDEVTQIANIGTTTISAADWVAVSNLSGTNTGDQTITLTGNVTGTGTGSFATTIAANAVTLAMLEDGTQGDILYYGAAGAPTRLGAGTSGQVLQTQGAGANPQWATPSSGVTDHTLLSNIGTNSHTDIDTHLALVTEHLDWSSDLGATNLHPNNSENGVLALTSSEVSQLANIGTTTISAGNWSAIGSLSGSNTGDQTIILTGQVTGTGTGSFATTLDVTAITGQTALTSGLVSTDELLLSDAGVIKRMDVSVLESYMESNVVLGTAAQPNITSVGTLTGFTSTGIDDNASGTRLTLANNSVTIGEAGVTAFNILRGRADSATLISGGTGASLGATLTLWGESHATAANKIRFQTGGTTRLEFDGTSDWDFQANAITTTGALTCGALTVTGAITATGDITAYYTSDIAQKQYIEPISGALDKVMALAGSRYEYKDKPEKKGKFYGLMAQDVQKVLPELVHENADGELTIRMAGFELVAVLVEAIKELKDKVDDYASQRSN